MSDSRVNRLREGQIMHCPDCGHGFPVRDPGAADEIEHLESRVAELGAALQHFYDYGYDRGRCEQALGGDDE